MSGVGVIDIYDTIKNSNGEHCRICFQAASVRKLVDPVYLKQFQDAMKINSYLKEELKVCYTCESLAARAVKFLWAVQLAAVIEKLCCHIDTATRREVVLGHLDGTCESPTSVYCLQAKAIENSLNRLPPVLSRTDTLIVGSDIGSFYVQATQDPTASHPPAQQTHSTQPDGQSTENTQANIIPSYIPKPIQYYPGKRIQKHPTNATVAKPSQTPANLNVGSDIASYSVRTSTKYIQTGNIPPFSVKPIQMHSGKRIQTDSNYALNDRATHIPDAVLRVLQNLGEVVVLVDNYASPEASGALALRTRAQDSQGKDQFAMHLIVYFAGTAYVPFMKIQISSDGIVKSVTDRDMLSFMSTPVPDSMPQKRRKSPVSNEMPNTRTALNGNQARQEATVLKDVVNAEDSAESKKKRIECPVVLNSLVDSYGVLQINNRSVREVILVYDEPTTGDSVSEIKEGQSDNGASKSSDNNKIKRSMTGSKQPIPSSDRVDWEDKIPMDVISFVDATDPNPSDRIMQPNPPRESLGVISDVRTVIDSDVQIIENVECIDLC